jgi:cellulose synthase/poly-beta-1,6-N-acetylglucosamine synthase-like glycosyltransferase
LHIFWTWLLGAVALLWIAEAIDIAIGVPSIPSLADAAPLSDSQCPTISILFAGRDEAVKLPNALDTLLTLDYPRYEVVAVDDRSEDATGTILDKAAQKDSRLKAVRVDSLPAGWLGKPHALQKAYEASSSEWIVFTDADVHFAPDLLRRAIALAEAKDWEHMTLLGRVKMFTVGEKIAMTFFGLALMLGTRPWKTSDPGSRFYTGVGAFQMIQRSAYEKMGTHRRLAMEVVDDMKLGKLVKEAGIRSGVAKAGDAVSVHWHAGVGNIIRGTTKNFFATSGFKLWLTSLHILGLLLMFVVPVAALPFVHGWARAFAVIAIVLPLIAEIGVAIEFESQPLYALTYPIGALIFVWMILRSMIVTLWQGGIVWRGTFYPLEELKRGVV